METKQILDRMRRALRVTAERWQLLRFWRWWTGELEALVPPRLRNWYVQRSRPNAAEFAGQELVVRSPSAAGWIERMRVPLGQGDAAEQAATLRSELARAFPNETHAVKTALVLASGRCLRKTLRLPQAIEENLQAAIAFEMDRYTPFRAEQVYFDCAVMARDYAANQIEVALAVTARAPVDAARQRLEAAGMQVVAVWPGSDGPALNLLPLAQRPARRWEIRWQTAAAALFLVALGVTAAVL